MGNYGFIKRFFQPQVLVSWHSEYWLISSSCSIQNCKQGSYNSSCRACQSRKQYCSQYPISVPSSPHYKVVQSPLFFRVCIQTPPAEYSMVLRFGRDKLIVIIFLLFFIEIVY